MSGLRVNDSKSEFYCAGMTGAEDAAMKSELNMSEGSLPIHYLGVPLQSRSLRVSEYSHLVSKLTMKITAWENRKLSYAGRFSLLQTVLMSIHRFWCKIFFLPKSVIQNIQQLMRDFLWTGTREGHRWPFDWTDLCAEWD